MIRPTKLITPPAVEPVSLEEVKAQSVLKFAEDDGLLNRLISVARQYAENVCWRALISQTWDVYFDAFSDEMELPRPPLQSVTSVSYVDEAGVTQVLDSAVYEVDSMSDPGVVRLAYGQSWPATRDKANAVTIRYVAGYGAAAADVPEGLRHAILLLVGHWYENREDAAPVNLANIPTGVQALLGLERMLSF